VVDLHRALVDMRLESVVVVGERWDRVRHEIAPWWLRNGDYRRQWPLVRSLRT
jgi:hypothetical protein